MHPCPAVPLFADTAMRAFVESMAPPNNISAWVDFGCSWLVHSCPGMLAQHSYNLHIQAEPCSALHQAQESCTLERLYSLYNSSSIESVSPTDTECPIIECLSKFFFYKSMVIEDSECTHFPSLIACISKYKGNKCNCSHTVHSPKRWFHWQQLFQQCSL